MALKNIHGYKTVDEYIKFRLSQYDKEEKNFKTLFCIMFDETDNIMTETSDGYRIRKTTYGQFREKILSIVPTVKEALSGAAHGQMIGLHMANCVEWLELFWAILLCGYRPLIMNTRLPNDVLNKILTDYSVPCVISDGATFSARTVFKDNVCVPSDKSYEACAYGDEVIFMSSGTTENVKLCVYTGETFYHQLCATSGIIAQCDAIKRHYQGELKLLMLLPLCHIFGFIAVYLWFGFFARTFVFPNDLNPATIQRTVKKHKVTHIFAVPMVWEAVHKAAIAKITNRGEKVYARFRRVSALVNRLGCVGDLIARRLLREVREGIWGDSVQFLISGGSHISPATLEFFNGIGYHIANGYGMTEIGIASLELSGKKRLLNSGSIGTPLGHTEYSVGDDGTLLVKGKTRAARILQGGTEQIADFNQWFRTGDLVHFTQGRYYAMGRSDDLIVGRDGENLNPQIAEDALCITGIDRLCIFPGETGAPVLLVSIPGCFDSNKLSDIYHRLTECMAKSKLDSAIRNVYFTHEALLRPGEFKISRKKIAGRFKKKEIKMFEPARIKEHMAELGESLETEILDCFALVLERDSRSIDLDDNFFLDLHGTSMDYFVLLGTIKSRLGVELSYTDGVRLISVRQIADYIKNK